MIGAILAGGLSTRMGEPKHGLRLSDGRTMIEHVADRLLEVCGQIVVVSDDTILPDVPHIHDNFEKLGPIGGFEALLASGLADEFLVVPCDIPLVTPDILRALLLPTSRPASALRLAGESGPRPLPVRIRAALLPIIWARIEAGELSLQGLLEAIEVEIVDALADWKAALANINTPEEFASLARSLGRRGTPE